MNDYKLKRAVLTGAALVLSVLLLWLIGKYVFICMIPFIIAYLVSLAVRPASSFISRRCGVEKRFVSVFIVVILIGAILFFLSWLASVLIGQISVLSQGVLDSLSEENNVVKQISDYIEGIRDKIPLFGKEEGLGDTLYNAAMNVLNDALSGAASFAASAATSVIGKLPGFLLASITAVISTFYICTDKGALRREAEAFIGKERTKKLAHARAKINRTLSSYFKSYFYLMLITFAELFIGFTALRMHNALIIALIIALVDFLPVLGSETVLIPWAAVELLITGNIRIGTGLVIMIAIMYVIRQFAEPHIVGKNVGIHPLISLMSAYIGFVIFGIPGVIVFPMIAYFAKVFASGEEFPDKEAKKISGGN